MSLQLPASERSKLKPFLVASGDASPRDQQDLMERPFFSLGKAKRTTPILYEAGDVRVEVHATPRHGMATIWDADVLIWAASQIVEAKNLGRETSRYLRFTPYQLLAATGREAGSRDYALLRGALARLQSTSVRTTIRNGPHWQRHQFSWLNEWAECATRSGRVDGWEIVLPVWFYQGITDRSLVLAIDPAYFRLTGGIERWLYRIARKHAGRRPDGWAFDLAGLHRKSGSLARVSDFARHLRRMAARQPLPGYRLEIEWQEGSESLRMVPDRSPARSVDNHAISVDKTVDKPVNGHGTSHAGDSGLRTHESLLSLWPETAISGLNLRINLESKNEEGAASVENGQTGHPVGANSRHLLDIRLTYFRKSGFTTNNTDTPPTNATKNGAGGGR